MSFGEGDLHKRVEELESENSNLKYLLGISDESLKNLSYVLDSVKSRNDKLDALVRHLAACVEYGGWPCNDCPYESHECEKEWFDAMVELGFDEPDIRSW